MVATRGGGLIATSEENSVGVDDTSRGAVATWRGGLVASAEETLVEFDDATRDILSPHPAPEETPVEVDASARADDTSVGLLAAELVAILLANIILFFTRLFR